jgi:hypothetical protein
VVDWDLVLERLGMEYQPGSWFLLPESILHVSKKAGVRPWVLLSRTGGPLARGFARTTGSGSARNSVRHEAHTHEVTQVGCAINKDGRVLTRVTIHVPADDLRDHNYSCLEPDDAVVERLRLHSPTSASQHRPLEQSERDE